MAKWSVCGCGELMDLGLSPTNFLYEATLSGGDKGDALLTYGLGEVEILL